EHLLSDLFGEALVTKLAQHEVIERAVMTPHEQSERTAVAPLVADHQGFVGCVSGDGRHGGARAAASGRKSRFLVEGGSRGSALPDLDVQARGSISVRGA